ncbi:hypothetical protein COT69_01105 [candidate division WWE3 bacterium CG09_land_8_20_14_0_10_39_24]|uniref:AAA+ ATPase domain-containing protein n=2 Tax=Katanobacteria TaxID=422282 RepID=A0A2G9XC55_UNCKA|nr:MAG: hypothetical protein BK003_01085 [bacterium CG09_39_24]PIP04542.1 MAG: hypothetical protein COX53_01955 [candidate division WWE3 bacterium CG23_combo_of_CG06-09_8_20_14_all_40_14]PIS12985.1 MAG: hypothetical protein COT69_01105 [candidate division WWE3 bacterium CG09_land_8_20_14_0_10_39_24]
MEGIEKAVINNHQLTQVVCCNSLQGSFKQGIIKRNIVNEIIKYIDTDNILVLRGARQVGKTYILYFLQEYLKKQEKSTYFIDLEDSRLVDVLDGGVDSLVSYLEGEGVDLKKLKDRSRKLYLFIDEIQYLLKPSSFLKLLVDHHKYIQLIVSGSSSFNIKKKFSDSLSGRTVNFDIYNLSFSEFLRFKGIDLNLESLSQFHKQKAIELYKEYALYGGYPKIVLEQSKEKKERYLQQIIDTYVKKDVRDLADVRDTKKFNDLLKILASQSSGMLNISQLASICSLSQATVENYLFILESTYVIKLVPPFSRSSKVEVVKAPKIFFYDTGLMQVLHLNSLQSVLTGGVFETSVFSELCKKYSVENIRYWRTKKQVEIDFVLNAGRKILPLEVKENFSSFNERAIIAFCERYKTKDYKLVSLFGQKKRENSIFPWEI